jgi:hypothetical protein
LARQLRGNTRNPPSGAECAANALQHMKEAPTPAHSYELTELTRKLAVSSIAGSKLEETNRHPNITTSAVAIAFIVAWSASGTKREPVTIRAAPNRSPKRNMIVILLESY